MDRTLVVIRHGQTDWNVEGRFQGQLDVPLNAVGRSQAADLKPRLTATAFGAIYSSPLSRAVETAQSIAGGRPIIRDSRLVEIHHGLWQGRTRQDIGHRWPDQWERWQNEPQDFTPIHGEPSRYVRARVEDFLNSIEGTNILCVSHGVIIQTLISILTGNPEATIPVPANCSIHTFQL
jgi:broad specificity phosphatase PhoE